MTRENIKELSELLKTKGNLKQDVYRVTLERFETLKTNLHLVADELLKLKSEEDKYHIEYKEEGKFEAKIKFAGDVLIFNMHTNVFGFENNSYILNTPYVKEDETRQYCGMIEVYNFLADSFKYNRVYDVGYLIARIFINKDGHFFVEGDEQLGFLYKDFDNMILTDDVLCMIVENAMLYAIDYDLWVPKYEQVKQLTVGQKIQQEGNITHLTGKRVGFEITNLGKKLD